MARLRWLQVNKFRSVTPGTRLSFSPGYNVLLGQNGTGKTTLLNLVSAAVRWDFTDFKDDEFDLSFTLESDEVVATISVRNVRRTMPLQPALEGIAHEAMLQGGLASDGGFQVPVLSSVMDFQEKKSGLRLRLETEGFRGTAQRTDPQFQGPVIDIDYSELNTPNLWVLAFYGIARWNAITSDASPSSPINTSFYNIFLEFPVRFDESLEYFNRLSLFTIEQTRHADGHVSSGGNRVLLEVVAGRLGQLAQARWGADRYVLSDTDLPFLKQAIQFLDFESAQVILELQEANRSGEDEHMRLGNLRFFFRHRGGWRISEKSLSYGQKRMLAFMYYVATVKTVAIADELVNGLHHRWIRACIEALGDRQVFLTSQNPLLLDYLTFQSPEEVRSKFVLCRWEKGPEQMVWENMSQEAAEDFFASYKVGFQQVGELLQSKGLW